MKPPAHYEAFVRRYWPGDENRWFAALAHEGLIGIDWPPEDGGAGWTRAEQLSFISLLANHGCPLMPDSVSVIAPLVLRLGSAGQKRAYLGSIRTSPLTWAFGKDAPSICRPIAAPDGDATLFVFTPETPEGEQLGESGQAGRHLATCFSPALLLQQLKSGVAQLRNMSEYSRQPGLAELMREEAATEGLFLRHTARTDRLLALAVARTRLTVFATLFQSLGYYALLAPDPDLTANEPLPFAPQRRYLAALRRQVERDDMIQRDLLYRDYLQA